jgi:hypothetical protein
VLVGTDERLMDEYGEYVVKYGYEEPRRRRPFVSGSSPSSADAPAHRRGKEGQ